MLLYRITLLSLCLTIFNWKIVRSQNMDQLKSILPPSPTASSLGKYADWPVNLYTGVPSINVPLYELKGRKTSVPIALNYHASGIKVSEIASWVGLGFSLDAGGVITRSVMGLPDDNGGYLTIRKGYNNPGDLTSGNIPSPILNDSMYQFKSANGTVDSEPDYFAFNAMGKAYKFFFGGDGTVITQPASNVKITCNDVTSGQEIVWWKATLEDGTQLFFGGANERMTNAQYGSSENGVFTVITAWYLDKIVTPEGEVITFTYKNENIEQALSYSQTDYKDVGSNTSVLTPKNTLFRALTNTKVLSKIETELDSAVFQTSLRQDLTNGNVLNEIKIYSKFSGTCFKKFLFTYSYSSAANSTTFYSGAVYNLRLKLNKLQQAAGDNAIEKTWSFEYNPMALPSRASFAQDHWGYYNGAANTNLLPFNLSFDPVNTVYANREPDSLKVTAEMLTKITYPTQGYSVFNYQANQVIEMVDHYQAGTTSHLITTGSTTPFHIHKPQVVTLRLSGTFHDYSDFVQPSLVTLKVLNSSGGTTTSLGIGLANISGGGAEVSKKIVLMPGDYTLQITAFDPSIVYNMDGYMSYEQFTGAWISPRVTGGVRVKSIEDYDGETAKVIKRYFKYESPLEVHPMSLADYTTGIKYRTYQCNEGGFVWNETQATQRFSSLKASMGSVQGGPIGYAKVTTIYGDAGSNGRTVSYFSSDTDLGMDEGTVLPYPAVTDRSWRRGVLLRQFDYSNSGVLIKKQVNTYNFVNLKSIKAFKASFKFINLSGCMFFENLWEVLLRSNYDLQSEQVRHDATTEVNYFKRTDGNYDSLVTVQNFYYETPANLSATRIETTDSQGRVLKTYQRTAFEKTTINSVTPLPAYAALAIDSLLKKNMVSQVLQVEQQVAGASISLATTFYKIWSSGLAIVAPESVQVKVGNNTPETRILFTNYDGKGNVREQQKSNDVMRAYIYDYNFSSPIAEVVNADFASVAYTSFESDGKGNWSYSSVPDASTSYTGSKSVSLSAGAISKSGLVSGSYKVSFWATSGSSPLVNSISVTPSAVRKGWVYYETQIIGTSVTVSGTGRIDELRLYPASAMMSTYTYSPLVGITSVSDASSSTSFYEYDKWQRLVTIRDDQNKVLKTYRYNYKSAPQQ